MALATNIQRRAGSANYYARMAVPAALQSFFGNRREFWRSLGTPDPKTARDKALPVVAEWRRKFAALEQRACPAGEEIQSAVWDHYVDEVGRDDLARSRTPTAGQVADAQKKLTADIEAGRVPWSDDPLVQLSATLDLRVMADRAGLYRDQRAFRMKALKEHLAKGETALVSDFANEVIRRNNWLIAPGSADYRSICMKLLRAELEGLQRAEERDAGNWAGKPADPAIVPPFAEMSPKLAAPGETILELFDRYENEHQGRVTPDTWAQNRQVIKRFAEFIGETSHISAVNRQNLRDWKHALAKWPRKANDVRAFRGMKFREVIAANAAEKKPPISQKNINRYLSAVGGFANWLLANDFNQQDVMKGMYLVLDKRKRTRFPFTSEQLVAIFQSPMFHRCGGDKNEHKPGDIEIRDWRYWLPLISLYSGARLGEIAQLLTADVRGIHGVWVFHVTQEGSDQKSTKTPGSQRVVPMHPKLIELGFLDYLKAMQAAKSVQLFPELVPDTRGFISGRSSSFFNDYFRRIGVKKDRSVNFHSFRHGMADAFRRAGYLDEQFGLLLGHAKHTTTGQYGIIPQGVLADRVTMIEAVQFPELDGVLG
jgi:integrase